MNSITTRFRVMNSFIFFIIVIVFFAAIGSVFYAGWFVYKGKSENRIIYIIDVNNFNGRQTHVTYDYEKDETTGCISFKDEFGIKRTICNNYSITQF